MITTFVVITFINFHHGLLIFISKKDFPIIKIEFTEVLLLFHFYISILSLFPDFPSLLLFLLSFNAREAELYVSNNQQNVSVLPIIFQLFSNDLNFHLHHILHYICYLLTFGFSILFYWSSFLLLKDFYIFFVWLCNIFISEDFTHYYLVFVQVFWVRISVIFQIKFRII